MSQNISKYIDLKNGVRVSVINATEAVQRMSSVQNTYPLATMLVGRTMVAASLLASQTKEDELVSLYFNGSGPIESVFAESTYEGEVRGYTPNPLLELPFRDGALDLPSAIGRGTLSVVRTHKGGSPYRGTVEIQTGEVGDDVAHYLMQSHQVRSVVVLGVKMNEYGKVLAAGGILIELLPDAPAPVETIIAHRVSEAPSLSEAIFQGLDNLALANLYLDGFELNELNHTYTLRYSCRCNEDRLIRSIDLLPLQDIDEILAKNEVVHAKCEFCGQQYQLPASEVQKIREKKYRNSLN